MHNLFILPRSICVLILVNNKQHIKRVMDNIRMLITDLIVVNYVVEQTNI